MKGNPMKEKVIFTLSLACFIGIMWLSSTAKTTNLTAVISEGLTTPKSKSIPMYYMDDESSVSTYTDDSALKSGFSTLSNCSLKPVETDVFTFGDAFKYYRQCLGSDSSFHWKGSSYTTLLDEEVIIQVADSVQVKEDLDKNNQVTEIQ